MNTEPETTPGRIWVSVLDAHKDNGARVFDMWREAMKEAGHEPHEEPKISWHVLRQSPVTGDIFVAVSGLVRVPPMPPFEPTPATVQLVARRVAQDMAYGVEWDALPMAVRDLYETTARQVIGAAGQGLLADVSAHVAANPQAYKVTSHPEAFSVLAESIRERIEP